MELRNFQPAVAARFDGRAGEWRVGPQLGLTFPSPRYPCSGGYSWRQSWTPHQHWGLISALTARTASHISQRREEDQYWQLTVELIQLLSAWMCHNLVRQRPHYHWLLWRQIIFMRNSHFQKCSEWWRAGERSEGGVCSTMRFYKLSLLKLLLSSLLIWAVVHLLLYESQTVVTFQY